MEWKTRPKVSSEEWVSREMMIKEMKGNAAEFYPVQSSNNDEGSSRLHQMWDKQLIDITSRSSDTEVKVVQVILIKDKR